MTCACCGEYFGTDERNLIDQNLLITKTLTTFRICTNCVDALWVKRNPELQEKSDETD